MKLLFRILAFSAVLLGPWGFGALFAADAAGTPSLRVQAFYYPWYGNPTFSQHWKHWEEIGFHPPNDISSNYFPVLGAYDSGDFDGAVDTQMAEIAAAGIGVIVYSWWGPGSDTDQLVTRTMDVAARHGLKVAWHIEPYGGRDAASVVRDIVYIDTRYGRHAAFFRDPQHGGRGVYYIYNSLLTLDWSALAATRGRALVLAQTTDTSQVSAFDGMYTYAIAADVGRGWFQASEYARSHHLIWAPSIGPGYLDDRAVPGNTTPTSDRDNGATYDGEWQLALAPAMGEPTWITITSFNEWHEGSQIEAASSAPPRGPGYTTYDHAYGLTGTSAEHAYLDRTRIWVDQFDPATASPNLIANPSFEMPPGSAKGPSSWMLGSGHERSDAVLHTGARTLKSNYQGPATATFSIPLRVQPHTDYTLSGWIYDLSGRGGACIDMNDIPGELQLCASMFAKWQFVAGTWNSGATSSVVIRLVTDGSPNGSIYFDDLALRAK